jgi:hypothetical protein
MPQMVKGKVATNGIATTSKKPPPPIIQSDKEERRQVISDGVGSLREFLTTLRKQSCTTPSRRG